MLPPTITLSPSRIGKARPRREPAIIRGVLPEAEEVDIDIPAGDIRVADVWKIVPYENTVGTLWLTLGEIQAIMEAAAIVATLQRLRLAIRRTGGAGVHR